MSGNNSPLVIDLTSEDDYAAPSGWKYRRIELAVRFSNEISATRSGTNTSSESEVEAMRRSVPINSPTAGNDMTGAGHSLVCTIEEKEHFRRLRKTTQLKARVAQRRADLTAQEEALRAHVTDREKRTDFLDFLEMAKRRNSRFTFFAEFFADNKFALKPPTAGEDSGCQFEKIGEDGISFIEPHGPQCSCAVIPEVGPTEDAQSEMKRSGGQIAQNEAQEHRARFQEFCDSWSNTDQLSFEIEFAKVEKNFSLIQLALPHKTVAEIVQYYYWRKILLVDKP